MSIEKEFKSLRKELIKSRDSGTIKFEEMTRKYINGNTYLQIKCQSVKPANNIQLEYKNQMKEYIYIDFGSIKNPSTKHTYVYFVIYNYVF